MSAIFLYDLCLHTPRADCNTLDENVTYAIDLCLHTLRADCNDDILGNGGGKLIFASTRSVQIATAEMHRIAICTFQNVC